MPLEVAALPEDLPDVPGAHVGGLGHGVLHCPGGVHPVRANLEDHDALPLDAVRDVESRTDVWRGPAAVQEPLKALLDPHAFHVVEGHCRARAGLGLRLENRPRMLDYKT